MTREGLPLPVLANGVAHFLAGLWALSWAWPYLVGSAESPVAVLAFPLVLTFFGLPAIGLAALGIGILLRPRWAGYLALAVDALVAVGSLVPGLQGEPQWLWLGLFAAASFGTLVLTHASWSEWPPRRDLSPAP